MHAMYYTVWWVNKRLKYTRVHTCTSEQTHTHAHTHTNTHTQGQNNRLIH